jgi:MFS family permease
LIGRALVLPRFPVLRHRNFRLYVVGQGLSLIGFWMQSVAQSWLVYRLTESAFALGVVAFFAYAPVIAVAPVAGVVADRVRRFNLVIVTQVLLLLIAAALGVVVATGNTTVPIIVIAAAANGIVSAFDIPARQSFLVEMVGPEDLPGAIALNASIFNAARMVGPAVAGLLVAEVGEAPCFLLNAASYLALLVALARMRLDPPAAGSASAPTTGFFDGVRYVRSQPVLRTLLLLLGVVGSLGFPWVVLLPVFAGQVFDVGPRGYGMLLAAAGIGAVLSGLRLASRRYSRLEHRRNLLVGLTSLGCGVVGLSLSGSLVVALAAQALAGFGMIRYAATTNTLLQLVVEDRYRGRIMGLYTVMFLGTAPLGSLALGAIAERFGAPAAAFLSGSVSLAADAWLALRLRDVARREQAAAP